MSGDTPEVDALEPDVSSDVTERKQKPQLYRPGQSGNIKGRPKGSRTKLGEDFLSDLHDTWEQHGQAALNRCATSEPTAFCKIVANILPREVLLKALSITATVDLSQIEETKGFLEAYRFSRDRIGAVPIQLEPMEVEEGSLVSEAFRVDNE